MNGKRTVALIILVLGSVIASLGQTTSLTYQGNLTSAGSPADGSFDFEFALFDSQSGGSQLGPTLTRTEVDVSGGIFSVQLDFGSQFPGSNRFLEIRVRPAGVGALTVLSPRQPFTSAPYAIRSLSSANAVTAQTATNSQNATNAATAATAGTFTGNLAGDVIGTQVSTTVAKLQGRTLANTPPTNGQVIKYNSTNSRWEPAADEAGTGGGGTITGVTAGTGLTGGGVNGNVSLSVANGGIGTPQLADVSVTDPKIVSVSGSKVTGTVANAANAAAAATSLTAASFTGPLSGDVTGTQAATSVIKLQGRNVANNTPANGQVLKFNSTENRWEPAVDETGSSSGGTITGVTAGTGLTGGGATGVVGLGIANGGVGTAQLADGSVTDSKIVAVSGGKVSGTVANATSAASAINSLQLGGVAANQFVLTGDSRLSDPRQPLSGSSNYIQNQNGASQASSNFNISGTGKAAIFDAASQFNIGGGPALSFGNTIENLHVGGASPSSSGNGVTFVGRFAGFANTSGANNSFIGSQAGRNTTSGGSNTFVGQGAGLANTTGAGNVFFGVGSGGANQGGASNTFVGNSTGSGNISGSQNSLFGFGANLASNSLSYATAIGAGSTVSGSNSVVLGRSADTVRIPGFAAANSIVPNSGDILTLGNSASKIVTFGRIGIGTSTPAVPLHIQGRMQTSGSDAGLYFEDPGLPNSFWSWSAANPYTHLKFGSVAKLSVDLLGQLYIGALSPGATSTHVCWNSSSGVLANCSSSARYKTEIADLKTGVGLVRMLRPVTFTWRDGGQPDMGFIAEEVAAVEPRLIFRNKAGEIEGVNYDQITAVLVNAVNEQQSQIDQQKKTIGDLEKMVQSLKAALCDSRPELMICK